ncbi:MAG: class I SAM-dependent methyltransferase [Rivularia sp. (in: cyanobacteria)]
MNIKPEDRASEMYNCQDSQELAAKYDGWSENYDRELKSEFDYTAPSRAVDTLLKYLPPKAQILDAGVGTGLVGELLYKQSYFNLEGMDISPGMLEKAKAKNIYTNLYQKVMGEPLGFPTNSFDGIISVGTITFGHAPASSFDELVRITKPFGYIIFTIRPDFYESGGAKEKLTQLEEAGKWQFVEVGEKFQPLAGVEPDIYFQVWVYKVS